MNEFTPEWIAKIRLSSHLIEPPAAEVIGELLDEIQRLQSRIAELEAEQRWIPVSERLPEGNERIFVYVPPITYPQIATYDHLNKCFTRGNVTHWRPLPQPPKDGE